MVTSSAITDTSQILVLFWLVERTVTCLPMMLSVTSAFSPMMTLSMIAEFSICAPLPIRVKLSMQELIMRVPSSIWQCLPMSTAPFISIFRCLIFWMISSRLNAESLLSP